MNWKEWREYADNEALWRDHQEKGLLKAEYVRDYALIWPNPETGAYYEKVVDIALECIRFFCEKYGKKLKASEKPISNKAEMAEHETIA
jgi:hypothetical protein